MLFVFFILGQSNSNLQLELGVMTLPVSERCDYQPLGTTEEFHLVGKIHVSYGYQTLVLVLNIVKSCLLQPFEVCWGLDVLTALQREEQRR